MRSPRKKNRTEEKHEEIKTEDSSELYSISLDKKNLTFGYSLVKFEISNMKKIFKGEKCIHLKRNKNETGIDVNSNNGCKKN